MVAFYPGQQNKLTEHSYGSLGLLSNVHIGNAHSEQIRFLNLDNGENSYSEERQQACLKPILGQNSGHSDEQLMNQNLMANGLLQINMLSKGQNQFQDFQVNLQKNSDGLEQKQDAPSNSFCQTLEVVPQSIIKAQQECLQNGADQQLNSFDTRNGTAVAGQFLDRSTSLTGNSKPHSISDLNQQQCWSVPLSGSSFNHVYDGNVGERFGAWQALQGPSTLFESGNNLQSLPNAKPNICRPDSSKQTYFWSGNVFRPVEAFHKRHIEYLNVPTLPQAISKNDSESPGMLADSSFQPYLKNSCSAEDPMTRQGTGWKETQRTTDTACTRNPSLEPDVHLESSWKILSPPSEPPAVLETMDQSLDQDGLDRSRIQDAHQGNIETEAPYRMKLTPRKANLVNRHEIQQSHQPCEEVFSGRDFGHHQNENLDPEGSHHSFQFGSAPGEQNGKLVPNGRKDAGTPFDEKRVEPEADGGAHVDLAGAQNIMPPNNLFIMEKNPSVEKEIEISEPTDASPPSGISLAHFRPSQLSSPLSPHNIRLALGPPSQSSQISRQVLDGNLVGHNVSPHPGYGVRDHQLVKGESTFMSREGGRSIEAYERVLQNSSGLISVQNASIPSFVSNENIHSKSLPPSSFAPGQEFLIASREDACIGAHELLISFENSIGAGQQKANAEKTFLSTSVQSNANMMSYCESQVRSSAECTTQSSFTPDHSTQLTFVSNSSHNLLDWHMPNLALQRLGERTQGTDFLGLLTTSKISLSEHSNCLVGNEAFSAFGPISGGVAVIESVQLPPETEMMRKSIDTQIFCTEGISSVPRSSTGSQNCADEHKVLSEPLQEKTFSVLEANGLATHGVEQEQRSPFPVKVSRLNGSGFSLQARGPGHGQDQPERIDCFSPLSGSTAVLPQSGRQSRMYNSLEEDTVSPAFLVKGKSVQHQIDKGIESLSFSQMSEALPLSGVKVVFFSEAMAVPGGKLSEAKREPSKSKGKPGIFGGNKANLKGIIEELAPHTFHRSGQNAALLEFRSISQQNFSCAEGLFQRELQVQDSLRIVPGQLPDQARDNLALDASSMVGKGRNAEAMFSSVPYLGNNCSEHLPSSAHVHHDLSDGCEVSASSQQFLDKKPGRAVPYVDPSPCTPDGLTDLGSKEVDSRSCSRDTSLPIDEIPQHPLCPLTTEYHAPFSVCPKKRKKLSPPLIPWHVAAIQPQGQLLSTSEAELLWANGTNRLPEKDAGELYDGGMSSVNKAKRRLRLTTQLMQQIIPPPSGALMHGSQAVDNECAAYNLSKLSLRDACRLVAATSREVKSVQNDLEYKTMVSHGKSGHWNVARDVAIRRIVERLTDKLMQLDCELSRLDRSTSMLEIKGELLNSEKVSIVNRMARQHVISFSLDSSRHCIENSSDFSTGIQRPTPQKYVTAVPMPRTLPYVRCLSL